MLIALTREISPAFAQCQLTHLPRVAIDLDRAGEQHREYERCLRKLGCATQRLATGPDVPDSVFIEDIAVVFEEVALITRPGAAPRRLETPVVSQALSQYRPIVHIEPPGNLDGGDVLQVGKRVFVGCSSRTNLEAIGQVRELLGARGYSVHPVAVRGCLHLKTAVTSIADDLLLINKQWVSGAEFSDFHLLEVHADEPFGANALRVSEQIVYPSAFPRTRELMERRGLPVQTVDVGELEKAEGGVTCCSLIFSD